MRARGPRGGDFQPQCPENIPWGECEGGVWFTRGSAEVAGITGEIVGVGPTSRNSIPFSLWSLLFGERHGYGLGLSLGRAIPQSHPKNLLKFFLQSREKRTGKNRPY